jgi:hypothetical protein
MGALLRVQAPQLAVALDRAVGVHASMDRRRRRSIGGNRGSRSGEYEKAQGKA